MPRKRLSLALAAAIIAALAAYLFVRWELSGTVAVVEVRGYIFTKGDADYYTRLLDSVYRNGSVKAVVVVVDSFGGSANYVEQVYYSLKQLKQRKPVVVLAVNALSGGYYISVAADYILAHPTSLIGSVGVIATAPPLLIPSEVVLETGAYKHTGFSRLGFFEDLSRALNSFLSAVEEGRGARLRATREELLKARVYLGAEAVELGLVDGLGSLQQAVEEAARRARLLSYTVALVSQPGGAPPSAGYTWRNVTVSLLESLQPPPALYYVYLPAPQLAAGAGEQRRAATAVGGRALVDLSHGNRASWWSLDALLAELALRNVTVGFVDSWGALVGRLSNATCLIVAAPTRPYSPEEVEVVEGFVRRGGVLLLLFDPSFEYLGLEGVYNYIVAPINSLAERFGVTFAYGYLWSERDYLGIYRNVRVRDLANVSLFAGVRELVLFTATAVRSRHAVAWTTNSTYLSSAEAPGRYAVAALERWGNGTVVALGDITIFSEPFCRVSDNYAFIRNLAALIANATPPAARAAEGRIERPNLPVGTVKVFEAEEDGMTYEVTWRRVSEGEVVVETPQGTTRYFYVDGRLRGWASDGVNCTYDKPLPEPPFPLSRGSSWSYSTGFTLAAGGAVYRGFLEGSEQVESLERVRALDGREYLCARIRLSLRERLFAAGVTVVTSTEGYYWLSSEAGTVKQEFRVSRLYGGGEASSLTRRLILKSIRLPGGGG